MIQIKISKTGQVKNLVNLTAEDVVILDDHDRVITKVYSDYTAKGHTALQELDKVEIFNDNGMAGAVSVANLTVGAVLGLPEPREDTYLIVDEATFLCAEQERTIVTDLITLGDPFYFDGKLIGYRKLVLKYPFPPAQFKMPHWYELQNLNQMKVLIEEIGEQEFRRRLLSSDFLYTDLDLE